MDDILIDLRNRNRSVWDAIEDLVYWETHERERAAGYRAAPTSLGGCLLPDHAIQAFAREAARHTRRAEACATAAAILRECLDAE